MGKPWYLHSDGKITTNPAGASTNIYYVDATYTSALCDMQEWILTQPINITPSEVTLSPKEMTILSEDPVTIKFLDEYFTDSPFHEVVVSSPTVLVIGYNFNPITQAEIAEEPTGQEATRRATCYGSLAANVSNRQKGDNTSKGGGGGGGGGGGPSVPTPSGPTGKGSSSQGQGQNAGNGQDGSGKGSGEGEGSGQESGGQGSEDCDTCDGSGMSGQGSGEGSGQGSGEGQGESGSGDGSGQESGGQGSGDGDGQGEGSGEGSGQGESGDGDGDKPGQGSSSDEGEPGVCDDCNGTGKQDPVDNYDSPLDEPSDVQKKAQKQAQEKFDEWSKERSQKCSDAADQAEQSASEGDVETAVESAEWAKECGNPKKSEDKENMNRAEKSAKKAIDDAEKSGDITSEQAQDYRDQLQETESSRLSPAQEKVQEALAEQDSVKAAEKLQEAADQVETRDDARAVKTGAETLTDDDQVGEEMGELAEEMSQRANEARWGIGSEDGLLTDNFGRPQEYGSEKEAQEVCDEIGDENLFPMQLPNDIKTAMDNEGLDSQDNIERVEFETTFDETLQELQLGEICTIINLDGFLEPKHDTMITVEQDGKDVGIYEHLLNYISLAQGLEIAMFLRQMKKCPIQLAVLVNTNPVKLEVDYYDPEMPLDDFQKLVEEVREPADWRLWGHEEKEKLVKWGAFVAWDTPIFPKTFGINSKVHILEEVGDLVKVWPVGEPYREGGFVVLLKSNLDCYPEETSEDDDTLQDILDLPRMPQTEEELKEMLKERRKRRLIKMASNRNTVADINRDVRVNILTGEVFSFSQQDLLEGKAKGPLVSCTLNNGYYSHLLDLCRRLDDSGIAWTTEETKTEITKISTTAEGYEIAKKMGRPLVIKKDGVGYL